MPIKKFWQHLVGINHLIQEGEQKLDIRLGTSKSSRDETRSSQTQRRPWSRCWLWRGCPLRERKRDWEKGVCTTMTTKWQLIETWIINATPHRKRCCHRGSCSHPLSATPCPFPFLVVHCPFAFVGSVERWPGKLPRMLTNWLSDWRTVSSYKTSLILPNSIPLSSIPPSLLADRQATS